MITNLTNSQNRGELVSVSKFKIIKLGVDVHLKSYRVVRQVDEAVPQPAQRFSPASFLDCVKKQLILAEKVYVCYEAGPFGFVLYRQLTALGVICLVVCPQNWDELGKGVKTDSLDALALCQRLDRYVAGNTKALALVHVPSPEEEQQRCVSRQREQLLRERKRLQAQGRSLLLTQGIAVTGKWWVAKAWSTLMSKIAPWLRERLEVWRPILMLLEEKLSTLTQQLEISSAQKLPKGLGAMTSEILNREIGDWKRFPNRRAIASYTGMCPSERSSGQKRSQGAISKHGNPRLRQPLVELAWRTTLFQPEYRAVKKWRKVFSNPLATGSARKKAIIAIGRQLIIDLWRLNTGRATAVELGLTMNI